ncbi:NAD(P)-binding domain-containing protein [Pseudomonas sp. WHRI 8519]|uniref:NAD(P)-binding domain-containing protein n=1 Tax=Pseudomonas sp. WHRI 8519 TaxID=3162567 RepID=UPI0032EFF08A
MYTIGILGVGDLTEKTVIGLRKGGYEGEILVSPRNAERAERLAQEFRCKVMDCNQSVVDHSEILLLGVRPTSAAELATQVRLKPGQRLLSLVAGFGSDKLAALFPEAQCVRVMLSGAAQYNATTVVIYPSDTLAQQCLGVLGNLVVLDDEPSFELATVAACMNGWFYFLLHDLQQWLSDKGLPEAQARALVLGNVQDCVASAKQQNEQSLSTLGQTIATPGTFTADGLAVLRHQPLAANWGAACEVVLDALLTRASISK